MAENNLPKFFNKDDFTGLESLGKSYQEIRLDYELDDKSGKSIKFANCAVVEAYDKEKVAVQQYQLLQLLQINCRAAKMFYAGKPAQQSYFPDHLTVDFIKTLPAQATPYLNKENMAKRATQMLGEYEKTITVKSSSEHALTVTLTDGEEVTYTVMACADVDGDTKEDLVLRLDWSIPGSFGQGFDLFVLSKKSKNGPIVIGSRYIK